jgi:serine/threonine protein kinase
MSAAELPASDIGSGAPPLQTKAKTMRSGDPFDLVGTTLAGKYRVETLVEQTDQSVVYRALHKVWQRPVAIKAFKASTADDNARRRLLQSFVREGALLAELSERSTAICQARDVASVTTARGDWVPYMVIEWLEGEPLDLILMRERVRGASVRSALQAIRLLDTVAGALALAHEHGIVHRDVKPGNIFVLDESRSERCACKLLDFGAAQVCRPMGDAGEPLDANAPARGGHDQTFTPAYGAPEQFSSAYGETGPWTDVYAFALVFVELVSGCQPLRGEAVAELERRSCDPLERPTPRTLGVVVGNAVERVVARALAVQPGERFANMADFWRALKSAAAHEGIEKSGSLAIPLVHPRRASSMRLGLSAVTLVTVGTALMVLQHWTAITHVIAAFR